MSNNCDYDIRYLTRDSYDDFIKVSTGKIQADIVLKNVTYLNVYTNQFITNDVAISNGKFVGIGNYSGKTEIDMTGKTIVPGFMDAHIHIESTTVIPEIFAKEALKHGTTAVFTDPHEIANVMGVDGIKYMIESTENLPMDVFFMVPSCVPSCQYDESGAKILINDMEPFFSNERVLGIAEVMDFNGVTSGAKDVLDKTYSTLIHNMIIDGHAPFVTGKQLNGYVAAGILSDHECSNIDEALEKMGLGLWIMIREGTAAQNLEALIGLCKEPYASRCMFCTDDRHINNLMEEGHIDNIIRKAIKLGADPAIAYKMASFNTGKYFGLGKRGAISPGFIADFVVLNDINKVEIESVYKSGIMMTDNYLEENCKSNIPSSLKEKSHDTFHMPVVTSEMLMNKEETPIIGLVDKQLLTTREGFAKTIDVESDILKVVVVERHKNTGHIGVGYIKGYGLKKGAVATSVAHDAHNIIAVGATENEIAIAINELKKIGGGMLVYSDGKVQASYPLPVAGLMSETNANDAKKCLDEIHSAAYKLGVNKGIDPFMTLSFTALPVIPELRITTFGVISVS